MARYVDADEFLKSMIKRFKCVPAVGVTKYIYGEECFEGEHIDTIIKEQPTADVEVVRHGEWIEITDDVYFCSKCNRTLCFGGKSKDSFPYCHCGAKMDGGKAEL